MARLQQRYRQQARAQARAEVQPQIASKRRGLHATVAALRSEEEPLTEGLDAAEAAIRHSDLSATDKALALKDFAERQADVPAGITSQIAGARELAGGEISDLQTAQAQQSASILASLLAAQATHQQDVQTEIAAEGRQSAGAISLAEQEKQLGLGSYAKTPTEEALEKASLEKLEAETAKTQHEVAGNGLTPYQTLEHNERQTEHHDTARLHAKLAFEAAKGELGDPHSWEPSTWQKIAALVEEKGKVPTAAAEKAVGAIRDHFEPNYGGIVPHLAQVAAGALSQPTAAPTSTTGASSLLSLLPQLKSGRY